MNVTPASRTAASLLRFSIGLSRVGIRNASQIAQPKKRQPVKDVPVDHGENIWVFNHIATDQIVYSLDPVLRKWKAHKQLPFNGKKTRPAPTDMRRDYWLPMLKIEFPVGDGNVGLNVFQKLVEFKRLHELSWGYQAADLYKMSKKDRGKVLSQQKPNAVADIAAVLGGAGKGNQLWRKPEELKAQEKEEENPEELKAQEKEEENPVDLKAQEKQKEQEYSAPVTVATTKREAPFPGAELTEVSVFWANTHEVGFVKPEAWAENVRHYGGLQKDGTINSGKPSVEEQAPEASAEEATEAGAEVAAEASAEKAPEASAEAAAPENKAAADKAKQGP